MMMDLFHKAVKACVMLYQKKEEKKYLNIVGVINSGVKIHYPCIITKNEGDTIDIGKNSKILSNGRIQLYSDLVGKPVTFQMGQGCYVMRRFTALGAGNIRIGNEVLISDDVMIDTKNHGTNPENSTPYMDQPLCNINDVVIGEGTWIGTKVTILSGVSIGKKCIIGAGAVVTKNIPDYSIAVGNPAKVIKKYNFITKEWERVGDDIP